MLQVLAVVGRKKSGKTTTIENLVSKLSKRGISIAVIKHISKPDFTIDTVGKDTWKFAQAGAKKIISVAQNEIAEIEKKSIEEISLEILLKKCETNEFVIIEGLKKIVSKNKNIPKIAIVNSKEEFDNAINLFEPILAFSGSFQPKEIDPIIPYFDGIENSQKLADLVYSWLKKV